MNDTIEPKSILDRIILFCLKNKLVVVLVTIAVIFWGILVAPFDKHRRSAP